MPVALQPKANNQTTSQIPIYALGLLLLTIGAYVYLILDRQSRQQQTATAIQPATTLASVPRAYTDFTGTITAIDGQRLTIHFTGYNDVGKLYERDYAVNLSPTTALLQMKSGANGSTTIPIAFDQLPVGTTVAVSGQDNLAQISEFTATKLIRY